MNVMGEVVGRAQVSEEKNHTVHTTHTQHMSRPATRIIGGKRWARRGGMAMVLDTQGERWKRPQVNRIPACPTRVHFSPCLVVMNLVLKVETSGLKVQTVANRLNASRK
jgi:hypothetical protein